VAKCHPSHVEAELSDKALTCGSAGASQHHPSTVAATKYKKIQWRRDYAAGYGPRSIPPDVIVPVLDWPL
jgi:hypothetical protein